MTCRVSYRNAVPDEPIGAKESVGGTNTTRHGLAGMPYLCWDGHRHSIWTVASHQTYPGRMNMGWDSQEKLGRTPRQILTEDAIPYKVLGYANPNNTVAYLAVESPSTGHKFIYVVLLRKERGQYSFSAKWMDESMGPFESTCPPRLFKLVDPPSNEWSARWRRRCQENWTRKHQ